MSPTSANRLRSASSPWRVLCSKAALDPQIDARAVALVAAGLIKGLDLSDWASGREPAQTWLDNIATAQVSGCAAATDALDSWSGSVRESVSLLCDENLHNLPDLFGELRLSEEQVGTPKRRGAIYTPSWLASRVTRNALGHWRRFHRSGKPPRAIADVSCGVGVFLVEARSTFGSLPEIYGMDNDPGAVAYCQLLNEALNDAWIVSRTDSVLATDQEPGLASGEATRSHEIEIDILLGNPPYVRSQLLDRDYANELRHLYPSVTTGNFDLSVIFVEHALRALAPGGIASYILSSKFMTSTYGKEVCRRLANDARVINIEDFNDAQLFPGRTTYTCVLTFAKAFPAKRFTITRFPAGIAAGKDPGKGESYTLPRTRLQGHPWEFATGPERDALRKLRANRHPALSQIFTGIMQGMRTGANQVYVMSTTESSRLESELLIPFVSGEDIRRLRCSRDRLRLLFPYRYDLFGEPVLRSKEELRTYPKAWSYLLSNRQILIERALDGGVPWYAFSRTQNLTLPRVPKLLVREMMPRAEFAADFKGEVGLTSGYALLADGMSHDDLLLWTAVLNTPTMEFALRHNSTQLHSGWFRLLKHHLKRTRLPQFSPDQKAEAHKLADRLSESPDNVTAWQGLDELVAEAFGLGERERQSIYAFLNDCHKRSLADADRARPVAQNGTVRDSGWRHSSERYEPVKLDQYNVLHRDRPDLRKVVTFVPNKGVPVHRWYPFTQGFSAGLVATLLDELQVRAHHTVLDPFTGVGTTNLVCRKRLIPSIGIEISPLMTWVSRVKTRRWCVEDLADIIERVEGTELPPSGSETLLFQRYFAKAYSPSILRQLVGIVEFATSAEMTTAQREFLLVGLIGIMEEVSEIRKHGSHYRYMTASENVGLQKLNTRIVPPHTNIQPIYVERLRSMQSDINNHPMPKGPVRCDIIESDARSMPLVDGSVHLVVTSPPYLNRNNYIAQQKAEMAILGLLDSYEGYRRIVRSTVRSHVEGRFAQEPQTRFEQVRRIIGAISLAPNNNPRIPHMIAGYFEDLDSVVEELARVASPGAICAFVVGNSRWGGVVVPVDHLLLMIAEEHGFVPDRVLVTRLKGNSPQQMRRYGRIPVRESIVIFRKP